MHTSQALTGDDFAITVAERPTTLPDVLHGFDTLSRLGIVIDEDHGAAGASTLVLAAVTAFYDRLRVTGARFVAYPDFFAFHVGADRGTLRKLDVFPAHKEVVVAAELEPLTRTINDRGITHLLVPDRQPTAPQLSPDTRASAQRRIRTAIAYSPRGRVTHDTISITASAAAEQFVTAMLADSEVDRSALLEPDGRPRETFRQLSLDGALGVLSTVSQ